MPVSLDDIDTGYEAKFDFPERDGAPAITYLLASVPRAGSSLFSHRLWQSGSLGAPLEYLNFDPLGPYGFAATSPQKQHEQWRNVIRNRTSPNGVLGLKAFPVQLQRLQQGNPPLLADVLATILPVKRPVRVVYLRRRNLVEQAVSYARASLSGIWRHEQEANGAPRPEYSQEALEAAERGIRFQHAIWEQMFNDLRIEPLELWHEDVLARPEAVVRSVADYIGVEIDPASAVSVPQVQRQSRGDAEQWVSRYAASPRLS